jgi:hypothetical protein
MRILFKCWWLDGATQKLMRLRRTDKHARNNTVTKLPEYHAHMRVTYDFIFKIYPKHKGFCYVIFNSHMVNAPRFNSEKDVSVQNFLL